MMSWRNNNNNNSDEQESTVRQRSSLEAGDDEPDNNNSNCSRMIPDDEDGDDDDEVNTTAATTKESSQHRRRHERLEHGEDDDDDDGTTAAADTSTSSNTNTSTNSRISGSNSAVSETIPKLVPLDVADDDDDGGDHAIEQQANPNNTVVWKPQNVQSTCEFTHIIKDYASKRESGCKKAEYSEITVDEHGNKWRLIIYVNGNGRASNHHLSLFLQVADAEKLPFGWKKAVSYVLTLEHPQNQPLSYAKRNPDKTFKLCPKAIDWGWSQFITSDRIQQEGFVENDSLTVKASVTVKSSTVSIDEEDAELYLKCAVEEGNAEAVKLCLEQGASVNCQFKDDLYTPLHTACSSGTSKGSLEVLNLLLEEGADGNACNKWRETPLLIAANNGHKSAVGALLKHKADPSLCSEAGWSALTFAAHKGYNEIVALLLKADAPVSTRVAEDNSTPLHKACAGSKPGHLAAVKLLLENGADVHALNKWRETPLLTAANHGQAGAVEALLKSGADPCKCTDTGWSPLSIAAYKGHDDVVRLLLDEGAPTEEEDPTLSALLQAATKGLPSTVELLLRHGADHTVTTKKGDTALSILVEQNLIDAAVEMVTDYSASIPRCSRDRKKIQRARLLINLRMKQLEKEGRKFNHNDDDESDDEDTSSNAAQNEEDDNNTNGKSKKKIKKGKEPKQSAEEKARVAEEALLRELEQEEQKQKQEEKEANSKRDKKRKKKEKERQQKMEEEEKRREQEEREAKERQRLRQVKEEQQKKEQELKLKEQREREMREAMEREKVLAAKRKDRERREREQAKLREKDTSGSPKASQDASSRPNKSPLPNKNGSVQSTVSKSSAEAKKGTGMSPRSALPPGRRWETKTAAPSIPRTAPTTAARVEGEPLSSVSLAPRNDNISPRGSPPEVGSFSQPGSPLPMNLNGSSTQYPAHYVEHPAIALFRLEKVTEMLQRCNPLANVVGEHTVKRVIYRWVVRAAHDSSPYIDPLIPSWRSFDSLATHFQRQFISESRRIGLSTHIETLREAGASVANLCVSLAKEVEQLERRVAGQLPVDWTDDALGMTISESIYNNESYVSLSWANRSSVKISAHRIRLLRERHVGLSSRFITSVFVTKIWYETLATIVNGTPLDIALSSTTQTILASEANVSAQLWSDPFTASEGNAFWGKLDAVDRMFGGREPFGREMSTSGHVLATHGGALSVFPPLDNMAASRYTQLMIDLLETASANNVPLSFLVFLPADCFPSHHSGPLINDLHLLDPRLGEPHRAFLQRVERLEPGRHVYRSLSSTEGQFVSPTSSLMIFLQNEAGKVRLPYSSTTMSRIVNSVLVAPSPEPSRMNNRIVSPMGFTGDFPTQALEAPLTPSRNYFEGLGPISVSNPQLPTSGDIDARAMGKPFSPGNNEVLNRPSRHGRLFDLVDDIEEDQSNEVDVVSGILNNLDMGLFQGSNLGSDVDIEAISLMGIGGGKSTTAQLGNHGSNFSTHFR